MDRLIFIDDHTIMFLIRGLTPDNQRDSSGEFNRAYIFDTRNPIPQSLEEWEQYRMEMECSHYGVSPDGSKIICGQEGRIHGRDGNVLDDYSDLLGSHGAFIDNDRVIFTQGHDWPEGSPYLGKIVVVDLRTRDITSIVSHENSYDAGATHHIQPNAHASRDGKLIAFVRDYMTNRPNDMEIMFVELERTGLHMPRYTSNAAKPNRVTGSITQPE
ncbi:MAG: hypothetical protein AAB588_03655 [Patescibacteria group bacterium]